MTPTALPTLHEMDQADWLAFAGAEGWSNGSQPIICEGELKDDMRFVLVLDRNGSALILDDEQAEYGGYQLLRDFDSQEEARSWFYGAIPRLDKAAFMAAGYEVV